MEGEILGETDGDTDGDTLELTEGDTEEETDGDTDGETDGLTLGLTEGETDDDGVKSAKITHDIATSSLFAPSTVMVTVPAVVRLAVVNLKAPASSSISS